MVSARNRYSEMVMARIVRSQAAQAHFMNADVTLACEWCYKQLFTKVCMGCKRFFLKERKNVFFLNKINLPYCFVVFFVVCSRLRPF